MESFEELQSEWKNQSEIMPPKEGSQRILEKVNFLRQKQRIAYIVLGVTMLILIGFFLYISAYRYDRVMFLLLTMIFVVFLRIVIEIASIRNLKKLDRAMSLEWFTKKMLHYYKNRKIVHYIITPLLILTYCWSFIGLLPYFKVSLSSGFYTYIQVSSVLLLIVLVIFIGLQIKKELRLLKELQVTDREVNKKEQNIS